MTQVPKQLQQNSIGANSSVRPGANETNRVVRVGAPDRRKKREPDVQVLRHGKAVEAIIVRCSCGQEVRVDCVYQTPVANPETN